MTDAPGIGHNRSPSAVRLKSFADRIERLETEKAAIGADIREVYSEAKSSGFDPKILRKAIKERSRDANERAEEESLLAVYMDAICGGPVDTGAVDEAMK